MRPPKIISAAVNKFNDMANPVMVKELYQAVNGRVTTSILLLFLLVQVLVILVPLSMHEGDNLESLGMGIFLALNMVLTSTCIVIVPMITGGRFRRERSKQNLDLMFITTLSPGRVIRGKWLAGMVYTLLIYSVCAPFMTLTWLLRGVGIDLIMISIVIGFMCSALGIYFVIMLEAIPSNRFMAGIKSLFTIGGLIAVLVFLGFMIGNYASFGIDIPLEGWAWIIGIFIASIAFCRLAATALISPPTYNISMPLKIWLTIIWAAMMLAAHCYLAKYHDRDIIQGWIIATAILASLAFVISVLAPVRPSLRVRNQLPKNGLLRLLLLPFYHTSIGGMIWAWLLLIISAVIFFISSQNYVSHHYRDYMQTFWALLLIPGYTYCYAMTAMVIGYNIFKRDDKVLVFNILLILAAALLLVPMLAGVVLSDVNIYSNVSIYTIFNPFIPIIMIEMDSETSLAPYMIIVAIWGAAATLGGMNLIFSTLKNFKPLPKKDAINTDE